MNTQQANTAHSQSTDLDPVQALDYIETLSGDAAFSTNPPNSPAPQIAAPTEPIRSDAGKFLRQTLNYTRWVFGALLTWIGILVISSMLIGPIFRSIATVVSGERMGLATYGTPAAMFLLIALYGFLLGRERNSAKRLTQSIIIGSLLALGSGIGAFILPNGNIALGLAYIAAQLIVFATAIYTGTRSPEFGKPTTKKGFVSRSVSTVVSVLIGMGIVVAVTFGGAYLSTMAESSLHNGKAAPTTQYVDIDHNSFTFADCKGKVTLVEFWAPWCGPCVASMPHLCSIQEQYGDRDDFVMVSIAVSSSEESATSVFEDQGCGWKLLFRPTNNLEGKQFDNQLSENVSSEFRPTGIPSAYIIDRDGKVVASGIRGSAIDAKLVELLED